MDDLDAFEKQLAADKKDREREAEHRDRKHRHRHHHHESNRRHRGDPRDSHHDRDEERGSRRERHRHRDRDRDEDREHERHKSRRHADDEHTEGQDDRHRHKRSRHSRHDDEPEERRNHRHQSHDNQNTEKDRQKDSEKNHRQNGDENNAGKTVSRESWMIAPSALDIDYVQRQKNDMESEQRRRPRSPSPLPPSKMALQMVPETPQENTSDRSHHQVTYTFGDDGSQWRMTKLKAVYTTAETTGRDVEDVAMDRFGSLWEFDDAREEQEELERRKIYGRNYVGKEKPSGELYKQRQEKEQAQRDKEPQGVTSFGSSNAEPQLDQGAVIPDEPRASVIIDQSSLNRLRAKMMKAKMKGAPDAAALEEEYNQAAANLSSGGGPQAVVLGIMESRQLAGTRGEVKAVDNKRGRERGHVVENEDMSINDMLREERRTKGQRGGEGMRLAERIAKDVKFDDDLDYMDENAERLAKRVHKSEINLKNIAVHEFQKVNRILDNCPLCHHEEKNQGPIAPVVSLGTRSYLTLPTEPEIGELGAVIAPLTHRTNLIECDDDEWEEIRNFMKSLTRMYHEAGREVVFYENAAAPQRHGHAAMMAVAIPYDEGAMIPAYFREAIMAVDEEWSQHRKIIDTGPKAREKNGLGRMAFRRTIAKEMPYFHVWFDLDGGMGHIVENPDKWPRGDLFAREVLGGILDVSMDVIKKQGRWHRGSADKRVEAFRQRWRKFDWTRVLTDG